MSFRIWVAECTLSTGVGAPEFSLGFLYFREPLVLHEVSEFQNSGFRVSRLCSFGGFGSFCHLHCPIQQGKVQFSQLRLALPAEMET